MLLCSEAAKFEILDQTRGLLDEALPFEHNRRPQLPTKCNQINVFSEDVTCKD